MKITAISKENIKSAVKRALKKQKQKKGKSNG